MSHGDGSRADGLEAAGLHRVRALALTLDDPERSLQVLPQVRTVAPELPVLVRAPDDALLNELQTAGATEVVPETLEASLMVASPLLFLLGTPTDDVLRRVRAIRHDRYGMLRALFPGTDDAGPERLEMRAVTLPEHARVNGRRIDELELERDGVRIATLTRAGQREDAPAGKTRLVAGDVLVLTGTPAALDRAEVHLVRR